MKKDNGVAATAEQGQMLTGEREEKEEKRGGIDNHPTCDGPLQIFSGGFMRLCTGWNTVINVKVVIVARVGGSIGWICELIVDNCGVRRGFSAESSIVRQLIGGR